MGSVDRRDVDEVYEYIFEVKLLMIKCKIKKKIIRFSWRSRFCEKFEFDKKKFFFDFFLHVSNT